MMDDEGTREENASGLDYQGKGSVLERQPRTKTKNVHSDDNTIPNQYLGVGWPVGYCYWVR